MALEFCSQQMCSGVLTLQRDTRDEAHLLLRTFDVLFLWRHFVVVCSLDYGYIERLQTNTSSVVCSTEQHILAPEVR